MRQIQKRLQKLGESIRPDDNSFTFEELCRSLWRKNKKAFKKLVDQDCMFGIYVAQFELEDADALRAAKTARSRGCLW
jgi:hypothetical protein